MAERKTMKNHKRKLHNPEENIRASHKRELGDYEQNVPMTSHENQALRRWVLSGHSVYEAPASRYACLCGEWPTDFLDVYRLDKELDGAVQGKNAIEREICLRQYFGDEEEVPLEKAKQESWEELPKQVQDYVRKLKREVFYLWIFLTEQGLWEDAREFMEENRNEPAPFEESW